MFQKQIYPWYSNTFPKTAHVLKDSITTSVVPEISENLKSSDITSQNDPKTSGQMLYEISNLKVVIPLEIWQTLMCYTRLIELEICVIGLVESEGNLFKIKEIFILDQEVSKGQCDFKSDALSGLIDKLIAEDKNPSMVRFWWHSHNSMGTMWSGQDYETGKKFGGKEYFISLVTNHEGEARCKLNLYSPIEMHIDNIPIVIEKPEFSLELFNQCKENIKQFVKTSVTTFKETTRVTGFTHEKPVVKHYTNHGTIVTPPFRSDDDLLESGPMGYSIVEREIRWIWNKQTEQYDPYDLQGKTLTFHELYTMGHTASIDKDPNVLCGIEANYY